MTNATFTGATVTGANLEYTKLTAAQLYSTASYQAKNLPGIGLGGNNLKGWDLSGQNLQDADFSGANLTGTILTGADLRGAGFDDPVTVANTILPDGTINGLSLAAGKSLVVRNYAGNIPITVLGQATLDPAASLQFVFDGQPWGSTISFTSGIPVTLAGECSPGIGSGRESSRLSGRHVPTL